MSGYEWIPAFNSRMPPNAVAAGYDIDSCVIYVGRAYHDGDLIAAKVIPSKGGAFVAHDGREHSKFNFDVLCGTGFSWVASSNGRVPPSSISTGNQANGERMYIGRGLYNGSMIVGKIHQSHNCLYVPFGGLEHCLRNYEALVWNEPSVSNWNVCTSYHECPPESHKWISSSESSIPVNAVVGGYDVDGSTIFVGRACHNGDIIAAKVITSRGGAFVAYDGKEHWKFNFDVLCGTGFSWVESRDGLVPPSAISTGNQADGEKMYVGRGLYKGSLLVGKIHPSHKCLYVPFGGLEHCLRNYETLVKNQQQVFLPRPIVPRTPTTQLASSISKNANVSTAPSAPPDTSVSKTTNHSTAPSNSNSFTCPVCFDGFQLHRMYSTPCGHLFCEKCIFGCLSQRLTCPSCNKNVQRNQVHRMFPQ